MGCSLTQGNLTLSVGLCQICQEAKAEADMEQTFRKLQRRWEGALFRLAKFIVTVWQEDKPQLGATRRKKPTNGLVSNYQTPKQHSRDSGTFTIIGEIERGERSVFLC